MLARKRINISDTDEVLNASFWDSFFNDWACSETGGASVTAIKIRKKLDLEKQSCKMMVRWGGWVNHRTKFHKYFEGEEKKESYKQELTSSLLIYWNSLYNHRQPHLINPIIKQSSFNYSLLVSSHRAHRKAITDTHTPLTWKQSRNFQLLLWFISTCSWI